mmetsp:Transcript_4458/g.12852  ORF Transcript_4458/g.12852 Transcript_4458/m.12852 type:complete len:325 (-) Transcript_4458:701-1675(-)
MSCPSACWLPSWALPPPEPLALLPPGSAGRGRGRPAAARWARTPAGAPRGPPPPAPPAAPPPPPAPPPPTAHSPPPPPSPPPPAQAADVVLFRSAAPQLLCAAHIARTPVHAAARPRRCPRPDPPPRLLPPLRAGLCPAWSIASEPAPPAWSRPPTTGGPAGRPGRPARPGPGRRRRRCALPPLLPQGAPPDTCSWCPAASCPAQAPSQASWPSKPSGRPQPRERPPMPRSPPGQPHTRRAPPCRDAPVQRCKFSPFPRTRIPRTPTAQPRPLSLPPCTRLLQHTWWCSRKSCLWHSGPQFSVLQHARPAHCDRCHPAPQPPLL